MRKLTSEEKTTLKKLFDKNGNMLKDRDCYFDNNGDLIEHQIISFIYKNYPSGSDLVKMHYAEEYSGNTHGNYTAYSLYRRSC